jgi:hypothetical protein
MLNLPPPPPPSKSPQTALDLVVYYRRLFEYHQQAAALASQQMLYHLEELLNPVSATVDNQNNIVIKAELSEHEEVKLGQSAGVAAKSTLNLSQENLKYPAIKKILTANQGKILHLDYLIWELYGKLDKPRQSSVKNEVKNILLAGEKQDFWYAVPDSPDCWTLDLNDFPDLVSSSQTKKSPNNQKNHQSRLAHPQRSRHNSSGISQFPYSERLEQCVTLNVAIEECLILHYPEAMNAEEILQWLYPNGLSHRQRKQVHAAIMDILDEGNNSQAWKGFRIGKYIWDGF